MAATTRRTFLKQGSAALTTTTALHLARAAHAESAADALTVAAIGCGGRGTFLARQMATIPGVVVKTVCDPDAQRAARAAKTIEDLTGTAPRTEADMRRVLDDQAVDAVTIGTPDHWHAPAAILACDAGKHVYVEKPCSHNIREGRLLVEAAQRNKVVVQTGTQSRSLPHIQAAIERIESGAIGQVLVAKAWNSQKRASIGKTEPTDPPPDFDYDLWVGPAPMVPFRANRHHYTWHWWYDFGTGDMGNDGVHEIDVARWGLGVNEHPRTVAAIGGKYFFDDDQQFADTQYVSFEYPGDGTVGERRQLIFEQRIWSPYVQDGQENGSAFYGTDGMMILSKRSGFQRFGPRNELVETVAAAGDDGVHQRNFIDAIRSAEQPRADALTGHLSASLSHLGNIATRLGRTLEFDPESEQIVGDADANQLVGREYRADHWATPRGA